MRKFNVVFKYSFAIVLLLISISRSSVAAFTDSSLVEGNTISVSEIIEEVEDFSIVDLQNKLTDSSLPVSYAY